MKTHKELKKELRELKLCIIGTHVLLFLYKESTVQICSFLLASFWSAIGYYLSGNLKAAPFVFIASFIHVKYFWIPGLKIKESIREVEEVFMECINENNEIQEIITTGKIAKE